MVVPVNYYFKTNNVTIYNSTFEKINKQNLATILKASHYVFTEINSL